MAIFEHNFNIGLRDVGISNKVTDSTILGFLEDIGAMHSDEAGYGLNNIASTGVSWILLNWKLKIYKRPIYKDQLHIKTWSRKTERIYSYRDYEIYNSNNELVAIATSKWVLMNINLMKLTKVTPEIIEKYKPEYNRNVFSEEINFKLQEPSSYISEFIYTVLRRDIDINKHMHNICYIDIAYEALPEEIYYNNNFHDIDVYYKKEIKLGETIKCKYSFDNEYHYIVIKNVDESITHAIIRLK